MPLNGTLHPNTVYFSLNSSPKKGEYHYGVVVTDEKCNPMLHHANNRAGPWIYESKSGNPGSSMTLIVLVRIGSVLKIGMDNRLKSVPADGRPSARTQETFNCVTWAKDAVYYCQKDGFCSLKDTPERLRSMADKYGGIYYQHSHFWVARLSRFRQVFRVVEVGQL